MSDIEKKIIDTGELEIRSRPPLISEKPAPKPFNSRPNNSEKPGNASTNSGNKKK